MDKNDIKGLVGPLIGIGLVAGVIVVLFSHMEHYAMFVKVENVLSDNLAIVKGVGETPTAESFLAEFKRTGSADGKTLRECVGEIITIEYRWKGDRAIVRIWNSGPMIWNVVGMHYGVKMR